MFLTRWKMMAGLLAVSLGGLAAMAGPCTKDDKGAPPPELPTASAPTPVMPPPAAPSLPPIPAPESTKAPAVPAVLPVIQAGGVDVPAVPGNNYTPLPPPPAGSAPSGATLEKPAAAPPMPAELLPPPPSSTLPTSPAPPMAVPADPLPKIDLPPDPISIVKPPATVPAGAVSAVAQAKYRILLRVGEGEPLFEVRSGDHLILKVVCEKVDVKSPEKGQGLSAVKAYGKVRFAGFGAEGTCDELNFLAGTGEVAMTGHVMIQVKDKLGRVESELSAETMRYRIDPHTTTGNGLLKP